jgi:hypothetical protein
MINLDIFPEVPVETEGALNDFTGSEAILGLKLEQRGRWHFVCGWNGIALRIMKMPAQGFAVLGVSVTLSGPACGGAAGGMV